MPVKHATEIDTSNSGRAKMLSMKAMSMHQGRPSTTAERAGERAVRIARKALIFAVWAVTFGLIGLLLR